MRPMILNIIRTLFLVFGLVLPPTGMVVNQTVKGAGITAELSPAHPIVGVTNVSIKGTASPGATVSDTTTFPDGSIHIFSFKADGNGNYADGPFVVQQLGAYHDVLQDRSTGASTTISYMGLGDFSVGINTTSRKVAKGQIATYTVTFTSVAGFAGTVVPAALNEARIPGATAWWAEPVVSVPVKSSGTATFMVRSSASTPTGTYRNIILRGANGSVTHAVPSKISLTVH
jgi:hypothetical protein